MPESVVREELEALGTCVQGGMQLHSGRRDMDTYKDRPLTPHFVVSLARGPGVQKVRSLSELCGLRMSVETNVAPTGPVQCKQCQRFGDTQRNCGYSPRCLACGNTHLSGECSTPKQQLKCCSCGGNHTANTGAAASGNRQKRRLQSKCPKTHPDRRCCRPACREQSGHATSIRRGGEPWIWLEPCCLGRSYC
jgi:hypothetical protein